MNRTIILLTLLIIPLLFAACSSDDYPAPASVKEEPPASTGRIFLFGEMHGSARTMERQLEIWGDFYHNYGMRHLFIETSYFGAQFLNMWMQADDDTIIYQLFNDRRGTPSHVPYTLAFWRTIKTDFPETIFHGTDVGHQSSTTGRRFLRHLAENGLTESESYLRTRENMAQFSRFRAANNHDVRAFYKPLNFIREFDALLGQDVMAIHGMAHTSIGDFMEMEGVDSMASVLRERYGDQLIIVDMHDVYLIPEPHRVDTITVGDQEFSAIFFGRNDRPAGTVVDRKFWLIEDAYEHFRESSLTGQVLPYDNIPMDVKTGQVFVVDFHYADGSVERLYFRASGGYYWQFRPSVPEFTP